MKAFSLSEYLLENEQSFASRENSTLIQSHDERASEENVILIHILINKKRERGKREGWRLFEIVGHLFERKALIS